MPAATYSFVAISAEQQQARSRLQKLQQRLQAVLNGLQHPDFGFLDAVWNKLRQLDSDCRRRKVEVYLIPALRNTAGEADALIADLDKLSAASAELLRLIGERVAAGFRAERTSIDEICRAMERYCRKLSVRLEQEEQALLPLARRCLSTEAWFAIAAKLLSEQAGIEHGRAHSPGGLSMTGSLPSGEAGTANARR